MSKTKHTKLIKYHTKINEIANLYKNEKSLNKKTTKTKLILMKNTIKKELFQQIKIRRNNTKRNPLENQKLRSALYVYAKPFC